MRGARPDAKVNTYLDLWLKANPNRGKSEEEKEEERKKYKPGDNVLPKLRRRGASDTSDDRRLVDEVRELSLRELGGASSGGRESNSERRRRERSHSGRSRSSSRPRTQRPSDGYLSASRSDGQQSGRSSREPSPRNPPGRQVEHQSSLRSLLSNSEDPAEIEEEIMRQILEDGLLDGLDLNDIDITREDEISERIATAFRQRREERRRERERSNRPPESSPTQRQADSTRESAERRRNRPPDIMVDSEARGSRPPPSRPHLFEAVNQGHGRRRRSTSQSSSRSVPLGSPTDAVGSTNSAARSVTDLSTTPPAAPAVESDRRRLSGNDRRTTDPETTSRRSNRTQSGPTPSSAPTTPRSAQLEAQNSPSQNPTASQSQPSPRMGAATFPMHNRMPSNHNSPPPVPNVSQPSTPALTITHPSQSSTSQPRPLLFTEPSISCNRCGKQDVQYDLHYNCRRCEGGNFNLCLRCYRLSRGCLHWYGFGSAAWQKYERQAPPGGYPPNTEPPHVLTGHRYLRPQHIPVPGATADSQNAIPDDDPAKRLQVGVFCDVCFAFANSCYWKCDVCNDGAWGYCNTCVHQGKHCTHPLLPLTHNRPHHEAQESATDSDGYLEPNGLSSPPLTPKSASIIRGPGLTTIANLVFRPLTFSDNCDFCGYPIPPSRTRFHCPKCNNGNYDICTSCYTSLVARGGIKPEDGHQGWRRCLQGHRIVVVGFEDRDGGQRRIVVNDLVGGHTLKEDEVFGSTAAEAERRDGHGEASWREPDGTRRTYRFSSFALDPSRLGGFSPHGKFPPDGGVGLRLKAEFTFYPADGVQDELCFPKGAEIREAEDINGDWLWGVYCGNKGLIPGNYVRRI